MPVAKVTIEEFDGEGNLTKRTITEYDNKGRAVGGKWGSLPDPVPFWKECEWGKYTYPTIPATETSPWWRHYGSGTYIAPKDGPYLVNESQPITSGIFTTEPGARLEVTGKVKITVANTTVRNVDFKLPENKTVDQVQFHSGGYTVPPSKHTYGVADVIVNDCVIGDWGTVEYTGFKD